MTEIHLEIKDEISKYLHKLGAPMHLISVINSWGDSLEESEVLKILKFYNDGGEPDIISRSSFN